MEADWEIEIGGNAPVIDALWEGFVDLRREPERAQKLSETSGVPGLADALARLNSPSSPCWTSKCDVWQADAFDVDELDAPLGTGTLALACYIDLLPSSDQEWPAPEAAVAACRWLCASLREYRLRSCRIDLIIREARLVQETAKLGITVYLTSCGSTYSDAAATLDQALDHFVSAVLLVSRPGSAT